MKMKGWEKRQNSFYLLALLGLFLHSCISVKTQRIADAAEHVIFIPSPADSSIVYETTLFTPGEPTSPTAPIVIINHGTNPTPFQGRERAINPTKFFLGLGWTVMLPMRRGYSRSTGERARSNGCNLAEYGLENAADIADVINWIRAQPAFLGRKIIMIGQSTGGLATMAFSSLTFTRADAIINFHGGVRPRSQTDCLWGARVEAFRQYAPTSSPKSLWIYTANDHSSNPRYIASLYKAFTDAGGSAELHQLPPFKRDGHSLFGDKDGGRLWQPIVMHYLKELNIVSSEQN